MNYHYIVLWYRGCKVTVDSKIFTTYAQAENYAVWKATGKVRKKYAYKVITLS